MQLENSFWKKLIGEKLVAPTLTAWLMILLTISFNIQPVFGQHVHLLQELL